MGKVPFAMDLETVLQEYDTSLNGLSNAEAKKRLGLYGKNELVGEKKKSKIAIFFSQFKDLMQIILIISAIVTAIIAVVQYNYWDMIDCVIILVIVIINAVIGFCEEIKADDALQKLKDMSIPVVKVYRNGKLIEIETQDVVVGDVIYFESGDVICADCYVAQSFSLRCDESTLTGESIEVEKKADVVLERGTPLAERVNMLHSGAVITYGRGFGIVVATGMQTQMGQIASMIDKAEEELTPIQQKLQDLSRVITYGVLMIAFLIFVINVGLGTSNVVNSLLLAIALAVAAIPESLTTVITIILALGVSTMSKKNAIVKHLHAVETLGSCQIICTDKTGTLTQNKMNVEYIYANNKLYDKEQMMTIRATKLLNCMLLCNDTIITEKLSGDPTETAIIASLQKILKDSFETRESYPRKDEIPFDSVRKMQTTINLVNGNIYAFTKGATDEILEKCTQIEILGRVENLTKEFKDNIQAQIQDLSSKGLRIIAFAYKLKAKPVVDEQDESKMIFLGLVAMRDPPRETTAQAVKICREAGIKPIMITGDHALTAKTIAKEVGIYNDGDIILTGAELDKLSDLEYDRILPYVTVYARVSPGNKVRIVDAWKKAGKVVAMTGDGVNDAPSIKAADIGVGMGKVGTEVTKSVADIVLADDNFDTIVEAVSEGRKIYSNIKKVVQFLLGTNFVEVLSILLVTLIYPSLGFLTALQILFINLVTDSFPALSLSFEKAEKDAMKVPPRPRNEGIFSGVWRAMGIQIIFQTACVVATFAICMSITNDNALATTMAFAVLSLSQIFHLINIRHEHSIFVSNPLSNKPYWLTLIFGVLVNVLVISIIPIAQVFGFVGLTFAQWMIVVGISIAIIPVMEIYKLVKYLIKRQQNKQKI